MPDLVDVIAGAVADATGESGDGGDTLDTGGDTSLADADGADATADAGDAADADDGAAAADAEGADAAADAARVGETPEQKTAREKEAALDKELEALGIKAPKPGERENRLPHPRVRKMIGKAIERTQATFEVERKANANFRAQASQRLADIDAFDKLAGSDPMRTVQALATIHPQIWGPIRDRLAGHAMPDPTKPAADVQAQQPQQFTEKEPTPDVKYADGTLGYSPERFEEFKAWQARKITHDVTADLQKRFDTALDKRFGGLERDYKAGQENAQRRQRIQQDIAETKETWGDLFPAAGSKEEADLKAYIQANPINPATGQVWSFKQSVRNWMLPRIQTDRTKMRTSILDEINTRPAAAEKQPVAQSRTVRTAEDGPRNLEDVIREQVQSLHT